jgi:hypothetical protein
MNKLVGTLKDSDVLWIVAFVGVCVLVGLGKLAPTTIEMMLMAVVTKAAANTNGSKRAHNDADDRPKGNTNVSPR